MERAEKLVFTSNVKSQLESLLLTPDWHTIKLLHKNASEVEFAEIKRDLEEPNQATAVREQTWKSKLDERLNVLTQVNLTTRYSIHLDDQGLNATNQQALFEIEESGSEIRRMWAGTTITLAQKGIYQENDRLIVPVYPINYTEWIACSNSDYAEAFRTSGLPLPYAGIGACVLMETKDGFIPLTRRGIETPVYPGRLYPPGGGPKPGQTSTEALLEEIVEETGLEAGKHFQASDIKMLALVADSRFDGNEHSRLELIAYLPINATFREVEEIQHETSLRKGQRQEDVWGIIPFSTFTPNLTRALIYGGFEMCPPTEAGLAHLLFYQTAITEGVEKALENISQTMKRLRSFERLTAYQPPIRRLANI